MMELKKNNMNWRLCLVSLLVSSSNAFMPNWSNNNNNHNAAATTTSTTTTHSSSSSRIFMSSTAALPEGIIKTVNKQGTGSIGKVGEIATVKYTCYLADDEKGIPIARSEKQKMMIGDGTMVPGWDKALKTMAVGERAIVRVTDPNLAYGINGVPPVVPPNAMIEFDIELLDVQPPITNIDFDSIATADKTPRTASEIQAAYEKRQAIKALEGPAKEGLEGWIEKAKSFYFFGFFEGETGQQAPWFLRPSITFPIAFAIVGAAFYVSFIAGAIYERGASVTDELDEFVLSMVTSSPDESTAALMAIVTAFMAGLENMDMTP